MNALPSKVTAGEVISCTGGHEVGRVARTVSLAHRITAEDIALADGATVDMDLGRATCAACGRSVVKLVRGERLSLRLDRGWVS